MSDETLPPEPEAVVAPRPPRRSGGWGPFVLIIVLLIPLSAVGWVAWQQLQLQREVAALRGAYVALQDQNSGSGAQFTEVSARQQEFAASLQQLQQQLDASLQQLQQELAAGLAQQQDAGPDVEELRQELAATLQQQLQQALATRESEAAAQAAQLAGLERELAATRQQIVRNDDSAAALAEAEMLLRLAQQRVALARDTETAIALFTAADGVLQTVDTPAAADVRAALATELAALRAAQPVDVTGLFAQLSAQSARLADFSAVAEGSVQDFAVEPQAAGPAAPTDGWWNGIKQSVGQYFVVTSSTSEITPQLTDSEQFQLRALVQLQIEQAKLALLQAQPELYTAALDGAIETARRWLRGESGAVDDFIATLEMLRATPIVAELPPADQTLAALRALSNTPQRSNTPQGSSTPQRSTTPAAPVSPP